MDGYSVQEAASVLGVAEGRVWELLARGVLLGTPEGDSMRVFLKAQPGPIASAGTHEDAPRTNGNGGSQGATGEASAFRELLTEFRNLTERYGQALLALGEARGEVAGLRSRVDQLEARLDLRLPPPADVAPAAWDSLSVPASVPDTSRARPPRAKPRAPIRRTSSQRKARTSREAVAGFADALARAQDPNAAELREAPAATEPVPDEGAESVFATVEPEVAAAEEVAVEELAVEEVAAADAAPEEVAPEEAVAEEAVAEEPVAETFSPEPMASADAAPEEVVAEAPPAEEPTADLEPPTYSAVVVEPDWFADGDFAWLDAAELEGSGQAESVAEAPEATEPEPEGAAPEPEASPEPQSEPQALREPEIVAEAAPEPEPEPLPDFEAEAEFEPWQPPEPVSVEAPASPETLAQPEVADTPEPPTASTAVAVEEVEEEVMWLGREPESTPVVRDEPHAEYRAEAAEPWPAVDAAPAMEVVRPPLAMTEDELARLALDEGWDDAEVAAIRAMITPPSSSRVDLPGSDELQEAMAALEAVPVQGNPSYDVSRQWAKSAPDDNEPARHDDWAFEAEPAPPPPAPSRPPNDVTAALRRALEDPGWLRRRQGPAAAAYRRLRRLFPG
jgi:hypothetical protein